VLEVLPFETPADASYGLLRTRLEQIIVQQVVGADWCASLRCVSEITRLMNRP